MPVLPQREADAVHRLIVGVVLGAPDLQGMGVGVQIAVAQEEGVLGDLMAAPDHVIGHHRRVAAVGGQTCGDAVVKDRVGAPALVVGRAGRGALPDHRPGHADGQQTVEHRAALWPPRPAAGPAQQHHQHAQRHQADAEALHGLGNVAVPPVHLTGLLVLGRKPDQQRRGGQHGKAA